MSRRKTPPIIEGEVPREAWDLDPIVPKSRKNRPKIHPNTRQRVYARDNYRCKNCGTDTDLTIDHVKPLSKGGANKLSNMQTLCFACNVAKGDTKGAPAQRRPPKPPAPPKPRPSRLRWAYRVLGLTDELDDPPS